MKKALSPLNIDKEIYTRMTHMLKVNPESGYKSRTQFVEKALEEKLDKIETEMVLQMIKDEGIMGFKEKTRNLLEKSAQLEKQMGVIHKIMERHDQTIEEIEKVQHKRANVKYLLDKEKHTRRVYKSKKK